MRSRALAFALLAILAASPGCAAEKKDVLAGPTELAAGATLVPVRLSTAAGGGAATLVIEGLAFDAPPGVMYELSLQSSDGKRAPLGLISFFNETAYGAGAPPSGQRSFDATSALARLGGNVAALVFEPSAGVTGGGVKANPNPAAHVRFSSVTIRR